MDKQKYKEILWNILYYGMIIITALIINGKLGKVFFKYWNIKLLDYSLLTGGILVSWAILISLAIRTMDYGFAKDTNIAESERNNRVLLETSGLLVVAAFLCYNLKEKYFLIAAVLYSLGIITNIIYLVTLGKLWKKITHIILGMSSSVAVLAVCCNNYRNPVHTILEFLIVAVIMVIYINGEKIENWILQPIARSLFEECEEEGENMRIGYYRSKEGRTVDLEVLNQVVKKESQNFEIPSNIDNNFQGRTMWIKEVVCEENLQWPECLILVKVADFKKGKIEGEVRRIVIGRDFVVSENEDDINAIMADEVTIMDQPDYKMFHHYYQDFNVKKYVRTGSKVVRYLISQYEDEKIFKAGKEGWGRISDNFYHISFLNSRTRDLEEAFGLHKSFIEIINNSAFGLMAYNEMGRDRFKCLMMEIPGFVMWPEKNRLQLNHVFKAYCCLEKGAIEHRANTYEEVMALIRTGMERENLSLPYTCSDFMARILKGKTKDQVLYFTYKVLRDKENQNPTIEKLENLYLTMFPREYEEL